MFYNLQQAKWLREKQANRQANKTKLLPCQIFKSYLIVKYKRAIEWFDRQIDIKLSAGSLFSSRNQAGFFRLEGIGTWTPRGGTSGRKLSDNKNSNNV